MRVLSTSELEYALDPARVADRPAVPRDSARLMVVHRGSDAVEHATVRDLPNWLRAGDVMVVNTTRVLRARLIGVNGEEGMLLHPRGDGTWNALFKRAKRLKPGEVIHLLGHDSQQHGDSVHVLGRDAEAVVVRWSSGGGASEDTAIERSGWTPLPPYIVRARAERHAELADDDDREWYQTVFAHQTSSAGSVAAPTAGLHFTPALLDAVQARGVTRLQVELQVGAGTFKPVETDTLAEHRMHQEWCHVPQQTLRALQELRKAPGSGASFGAQPSARILAVGTTTVRTLESLPAALPADDPHGWSAQTQLLIQPGHQFRFVDALMTNFHLPRSTLLALVGAFVGLDRLKALYADAQARGYRFFSYGDAMLII